MALPTLHSSGRIGGLKVPNRMVMAPMTRSRAIAGELPADITVEYYAQRASAGLILSEGVGPSAGGIGYARTPGIYSPEQVAAWKPVTDAVHAKGGHIFMQLMHVGRIGHPANRSTDLPLVAPSAIRAAGKIWTDSQQMQEHPEPRALESREIPGVIEEYAQATRNALAAGFDGVELHSASGYLPNQFLSASTNQRTDSYGGSVQHRIRFVVETLEAMAYAAGSAQRVGIKISPAMPFNDINEVDPVETYTALVQEISPLGLAYLHVLRSAPLPNIFEILRPLYKGTFLAGGAFTAETGNAALAASLADFIVYGKLFIANPDLPERFAKGAPLNEPNPATFYNGGPVGYTDYPSL